MKVSMYNQNEKSCFTSTGIEAQAPFYEDETHLTNHKYKFERNTLIQSLLFSFIQSIRLFPHDIGGNI